MQFDERKRKLIISGAICSAKKTFFRCKFVTTGFNTRRGRRGYTAELKKKKTGNEFFPNINF
jgi:hypothetical protein